MNQRELLSCTGRCVSKAMEMQESLAALRGGPRGPCNAKTTSSLQPLKKTIVCVKVFINCVQCYGCLELPICFYTPTPTHIHRRTNNPPLHPFPLDGMGSGLGGNEVTRTHPRACKNTLTAKRHPGFGSALLRPSELSIPGIFLIAHPPPSKPQPTFQGWKYLVLSVAMATTQMLASD